MRARIFQSVDLKLRFCPLNIQPVAKLRKQKKKKKKKKKIERKLFYTIAVG